MKRFSPHAGCFVSELTLVAPDQYAYPVVV
jgi:hypothetical protein